jgi:hypothetical protein
MKVLSIAGLIMSINWLLGSAGEAVLQTVLTVALVIIFIIRFTVHPNKRY